MGASDIEAIHHATAPAGGATRPNQQTVHRESTDDPDTHESSEEVEARSNQPDGHGGAANDRARTVSRDGRARAARGDVGRVQTQMSVLWTVWPGGWRPRHVGRASLDAESGGDGRT